LQLLCGRFDEHYKCHYANENADHVGHIVAVAVDLAGTAASETAVLLWLEGAGEGGCYEVAF
jgi:hypothetical protein